MEGHDRQRNKAWHRMMMTMKRYYYVCEILGAMRQCNLHVWKLRLLQKPLI